MICPVARGLFVCERVEQAEGSKNLSLLNVFARLQVRKFPSDPTEFSIFAGLTGGIGTATIRVTISRVMDNYLIYSREHRVTFLDRVAEVRVVLRLLDVGFPNAGQYSVELLADGELVAQSVIYVEE